MRQTKLLHNINKALFILVLPASLILLVILVKWAMAQEEAQEKYGNVLLKIGFTKE